MATGKRAKLCKSLECGESKPMGSDLRMYETMAAAALGEALYNIFYFHECMRQSRCLLIASQWNSMCTCTPETVQVRSGCEM
jgi:hypothetical protein